MTSMLKSAAGGMFNRLLEWPDKPPERNEGESDKAYSKRVETRRKIRYVVMDLGVIALGGLVLMMATRGGMDKLLNPGYMEMMMLPAVGLAGGIGIAFLISDLMGEKNKRTAAKIALAIAPLLLVIGGSFILLSGGMQHVNGVFQYSLTKGLQNNSFMMGALILASTPFAIGASLKKLS